MPTTHDYLEKCDRLAVIGGTFDPIHNGHIAIAESVLHEFKPRRVLFIPVGQPPHKSGEPVTSGEHRFQMVLSAICRNPGFDASRMEIDRPGLGYTVDTISALRQICPQNAKIFFIIGADALMEILNWQGAAKLLTLCEFVVVYRPGYEIDTKYVSTLRIKHNAIVHLHEGPRLEISGTAIRERFVNKKPVTGLMPEVAEAYARRHGLYLGVGETACALSDARYAQVQSRLEWLLTPRRFRHTLGTVIEAEKLATHYNADTNKAQWAALLHDCAKEFSSAKKLELCKAWGVPLDNIMLAHVDITHSLLGAEVARREFLVEDEDVLQAIARHTIGYPGMTLLDKIIMLADYIEPYREDYPGLAEMRHAAYTNIDRALAIGLKYSAKDLNERRKNIHPWSKKLLKELDKQF